MQRLKGKRWFWVDGAAVTPQIGRSAGGCHSNWTGATPCGSLFCRWDQSNQSSRSLQCSVQASCINTMHRGNFDTKWRFLRLSVPPYPWQLQRVHNVRGITHHAKGVILLQPRVSRPGVDKEIPAEGSTPVDTPTESPSCRQTSPTLGATPGLTWLVGLRPYWRGFRLAGPARLRRVF